jgi:iron complex outermembrane receptor protein
MERRRCLLFLSMLTPAVSAQDTVEWERVNVIATGTHLRIDAQSALPVQVITREEIQRSGAQNAEELLDRVTANFGGQREAQGIGDGTMPGFSGASLRGLGAGQTLVLLNGRRLANYAFTGLGAQGVDLHAIPLAAIERVEILKDGASAIYGSDAIAGVINFITRKDYAGVDVSATYSKPEAGGGERTRLTLAAGRGDAAKDGFNVFGVVDVQKSERLRSVDRPFAASGYHPELGLVNLSVASWPANILMETGPVNPAAPECTVLTVNRPRAPHACGFDAQRTTDLVPPAQQLNLFGRGTLRLSADAEGYAEVSASSTRIEFRISPAPAAKGFTQNETSFVLPASSPYYPTGLGLSGDLDLAFRTLPLGGRTSEVESTNVRVLVGMKSRVGEWDLDGALALNDSRSTERYLSGYVDAGRLSAAIGTGMVDPFRPMGPEGDALLRASQVIGTAREAKGQTQTADLRATRELLQLPHGPLQFAAGIEARHEYLRDLQGTIVVDVIGVTPAAPKEGARSAQAAFVELLAPLAKGLEVQAAARLDRYSDFGTSISPKLAARFQPSPSWLVRGSVGSGFRAPSLPELHTLTTTTTMENSFVNGGDGWTDPARCPITQAPADCGANVPATVGGNAALHPQRSTQASLGFVFEQPKAWFASVDFWAIRVKDTIGALQFDQVVNDIPAYEGKNVIRGPVDPNHPELPGPIVRIDTLNENLGDQRISGADLTLYLRPRDTSLGRFSARLDGTYVFHARQEVVRGSPVDLMGRRVPRWNHVLTFNLDNGPWTGTLAQRYRHGYTDENPLPDGSTRRVASYIVWDGQIAYDAGRNTRVWLGVRNLFDKEPPFTNAGFNFQTGYDAGYADPYGRTWTVGLRVGWH